MPSLDTLVANLAHKIPQAGLGVAAISASPVGWHIEHSLLTINAIIDQLHKSDTTKYKWKFKLPKLIVFTTKKIPRGRAKAPAAVQPNTFTEGSLQQHIQLTKEKINSLATCQADQYFNHPFFGHLRLKDTIKFLQIHTAHHLSIISDIIKAG
jgi:hypothetical protein